MLLLCLNTEKSDALMIAVSLYGNLVG